MKKLYSAARQYIRGVKSNLAAAGDDGREVFDEFRKTLKQYRHKNIDSSVVITSVHALFRDHPALLDAFKHFVPSHRSAAAVAAAEGPTCLEFLNRVSASSCLGFLNRVGNRFNGGPTYVKFLDCMHAYSRGEIDETEVSDEVVGLFAKNDDLVAEFARFLPETDARELLEKQRRRRGTKRGRGSDSGDEETAAPRRRRMKKFGEAKRAVINKNNEMEDALFEVDVRIGNLESAWKCAGDFISGGGGLAPVDACLDEHFSRLNLAAIRSLGGKFAECVNGGVVPPLPELMEALRKKKEMLERERVKVVQRWNRIRQSH